LAEAGQSGEPNWLPASPQDLPQSKGKDKPKKAKKEEK